MKTINCQSPQINVLMARSPQHEIAAYRIQTKDKGDLKKPEFWLVASSCTRLALMKICTYDRCQIF